LSSTIVHTPPSDEYKNEGKTVATRTAESPWFPGLEGGLRLDGIASGFGASLSRSYPGMRMVAYPHDRVKKILQRIIPEGK
jgi:hypothetical protein